MTGPQPGLRVRDLAPEHATLLRRVHQLAADATRLRQTNHSADPNDTPSTQVLAQIAAIATGTAT